MPATKTNTPAKKSKSRPPYPIGWARPGDFPTSRKTIDQLINLGLVEAYKRKLPGSGRTLCFVSVKSFNEWVKNGKRKGKI